MLSPKTIMQSVYGKMLYANDKFNLLDNAYIAFSGGKDSFFLSNLIDKVFPNNKIPRVFCNTGVEYRSIVKFVNECAAVDDRVIIVKPSMNLREMFKAVGYPFKSKEHSKLLDQFYRKGYTATVNRYIKRPPSSSFACPDKLLCQFEPSYNFRISHHCCDELKKKPSRQWSRENNRPISITGIRRSEGGVRAKVSDCLAMDKHNKEKLSAFHPLLPVTENCFEYYTNKWQLKFADIYYPPYNFTRTGCKGCPFNPYLRRDLETLSKKLPEEFRQCLAIWSPVYNEYIRLQYRLIKKNGELPKYLQGENQNGQTK